MIHRLTSLLVALLLILASAAVTGAADDDSGATPQQSTEQPTDPKTEEPAADPLPPSVPDGQPYDPDNDPYAAENYVRPQEPGLDIGDPAPELSVIDANGTKINLEDLWSRGPLILVFIRGGWCARCVRTMRLWNHHLDRAINDGAYVIAITPLKPEKILPLIDIYKAEFPMFSDRDGRIGRAFKVRNIINESDQLKFYETVKLDLSTIHADGTWDVPAHSTFIIDRDGIIRAKWASWSSVISVKPDKVLNTLEHLDLPSLEPEPAEPTSPTPTDPDAPPTDGNDPGTD